MLPDLDASADAEIVADNVRVVQAIYFAQQLERMRAFQVVDRLAELFRQGMLPLGRGSAGKLLRRYWRNDARLTEAERRNLYARALGAPDDGSSELSANREFTSLWLRLVSSVAMLEPCGSAPDGSALPARTAVTRAARALAANVSVHGAGLAGTARRLSADANLLRTVLQAPETRRAYGARDMWQVIDQVVMTELGGATNASRLRRLAEAGSAVLQWLADHAAALGRPAGSCTELPFHELADAVDQWLAAGAGNGDAAGNVGPSIRLQAIAHGLIRLAGLDGPPHHGGLTFFCGAAGTGRTLGAHAVAAALSRELVRVDLRRIVSQYIGETEGALEGVFADAERTGAVLLLDEADALFGRRAEAQDVPDRRAAVERDALLRRLQAHKGLVIFECSSVPALTDEHRWARVRRVMRFPRSAADR